jgi:hypothetical protein
MLKIFVKIVTYITPRVARQTVILSILKTFSSLVQHFFRLFNISSVTVRSVPVRTRVEHARMKLTVFWGMKPCSLLDCYWRFGGTCCSIVYPKEGGSAVLRNEDNDKSHLRCVRNQPPYIKPGIDCERLPREAMFVTLLHKVDTMLPRAVERTLPRANLARVEPNWSGSLSRGKGISVCCAFSVETVLCLRNSVHEQPHANLVRVEPNRSGSLSRGKGISVCCALSVETILCLRNSVHQQPHAAAALRCWTRTR